MVNDTSTLNGALQELGETMADNLVSMGVVDATASDGLTTLANRILDIEPSIGGLDLDTAVSISSSDSRITLGSSIVLTSKLTASYDDKTLVDVDLTGVLQNATVKYFNGSTLIGSGVTDINGIATATITPSAIGTLSLKAVFEGTDNFKNCESSSITVTVVAPSYDGVEITSDKSILSYYDSDSAVLTAQLLDGSSSASVSGVNIGIYQDNVLVDTVTTGNDGSATYTYNSQGIGDTVFEAKVGSLSSETYTVEDCIFYGLNTNAFTIPSNTTFSSNGQYITATTNTIGEKLVTLNHTLANEDNWVFENEVAYKGESEQLFAIIWNDNTYYGGAGYGENYVYSYMGSQTKKTHTVAIGDKFTVRRENGTTSVYINGDLIESKTVSHKSTFKVGYFINKGRAQYYKNIKIKPL